MSAVPACPQCTLADASVDDGRFVCANCGYEWAAGIVESQATSVPVRDCNGNTLEDGDNVVVIKDLKVKGSAVPLKQGTLIRGIRLVEDDAAHIEGNTDRIKGLVVKTCYVRRA